MKRSIRVCPPEISPSWSTSSRRDDRVATTKPYFNCSNLVTSPSITATAQLGVQYSVLKLYSWPELSRVPSDLVLDAARVCALLAVRPTSAPLIARLLDLPRERVAHVVELLHLYGHLDGSAMDVRPVEKEEQATLDLIADPTPTKSPTLLGRLWQKLSGRRD